MDLENQNLINHIKIEVPDDSSEDISRSEEKWSNNNEDFIRQLQKDCKQKANLFDKASHITKKRYNQFSIPTIITPIVMSVVSPYLSENYQYINAVSLAFVGVLNGVQSFYNYGKKSSLFNEYSGKYMDLVNSIDIELSKGKKYRVALDVYLERISSHKSSLDNSSPFL